jgi:hypothetical protein
VQGVFVDLGTAPLDSVTIGTIAATGEAGAYVAGHEFPHPTDFPAVEPARQQAIRAAMDLECKAGNEFRTRSRELGVSDKARAIVGRTFALRSVRFGSHNVLAAVHVAGEDEHGVVLA